MWSKHSSACRRPSARLGHEPCNEVRQRQEVGPSRAGVGNSLDGDAAFFMIDRDVEAIEAQPMEYFWPSEAILYAVAALLGCFFDQELVESGMHRQL